MFIKKYIYNLLKPSKKNEKKYIAYLKNYTKRFTILSCAISYNNIEIINARDNVGGYYEQKLILPSNINISTNLEYNVTAYVLKILFSLTSKKLNFYLPENKNNLDYMLLASILTVKKIHKTIYKTYPKSKDIAKKIYTCINLSRSNINKLHERIFILEILIRKLTYSKIKSKKYLNKNEKLLLYKIENINNVTQYNLKEKLKNVYNELCIIHKKYNEPVFYQIWGYLYFKKRNKKYEILKKTKKENTTIKNYKNSVLIKKQKTKEKKEKTSINSLFDYRKTSDNYSSGDNNYKENTSIDELNNMKNLNIDNVTKDQSEINTRFSADIINKMLVTNLEKHNVKFKKFIYKEWDFKNKKYRQNWCNVFLKKESNYYKINHEKNIINNIINENKNDILRFKERFKLIFNKKSWIKGLINGEDIDLDLTIDNYKDIKKDNNNKIYKRRKNIKKNIALLILFDSSLSTDSYIENNKIIDVLKKLVIITACGVNYFFKNFSVATFFSNTRHDCKYIIIKDFNETWYQSKYNIAKIKPNGYTRIGPAIRHSISYMKKISTKQKLILILSDGKPTDYDEYEGLYGINDIKCAISEAYKEKIKIKSIIVDNMNKSYFPNMFGKNNYQTLSSKKPIYIQLEKIFKNFI